MATDTPTTNRRSGWALFAGVLLIVAGGARILDGLWALKRDNDVDVAPVLRNLLVFDDNLAAWGWFFIILGALLIIAGIAVFNGEQWARWFGIVFAAIAIFSHFASMYAFPVPALAGVVLDSLVLYALLAYGGRDEVY